MKEILQEVMMMFKCWYIFATVIIAITAGCAPKPQIESPTPSSEVKMPSMPEHDMNSDAKMAQGNNPKALFDVKCQKCHQVSEVFEKADDCATCHKQGASLEGKVADVKWAELVKEMQGKKADWIKDSEATTISDWLAAEHSPKHK